MEQYRSPAQLAQSNPGAIDGFEIEIRRLRAGLDAGSVGRVHEVCDEVLQPEVLIVVFRHPPLLPDHELVQTPRGSTSARLMSVRALGTHQARMRRASCERLPG